MRVKGFYVDQEYSERRYSWMSSIVFKKINITDLNIDAIVNAVNEELWAGREVCGAIFNAAGHTQLKKAIRLDIVIQDLGSKPTLSLRNRKRNGAKAPAVY